MLFLLDRPWARTGEDEFIWGPGTFTAIGLVWRVVCGRCGGRQRLMWMWRIDMSDVLPLRHTMEQELHTCCALLVMNAKRARAALEKASAERDVKPASFLQASTASSEGRMKYGPVEGCDPRCLGPRRS